MASNKIIKKGNTEKDRSKILSIIYFVDSEQTRSIKLPLKYIYTIIGISFFVIFWCFLVTVAIIQKVRNENHYLNKIESLLLVIFDYQVKYENAYENAYSTKEGFGQENYPSQLPAKQTLEKDEKSASRDLPEKKAPNAEIKYSSNITVESGFFLENNNSFEFRFDLRNLNSPATKQGYITGVGHFLDTNGKSNYLPLPSTVSINNEGIPTQLENGYHFSIRHFKRKTLTFPKKKNETVKFSKIKLFIIDEEKNSASFDFENQQHAPATQGSDENETTKKDGFQDDTLIMND